MTENNAEIFSSAENFRAHLQQVQQNPESEVKENDNVDEPLTEEAPAPSIQEEPKPDDEVVVSESEVDPSEAYKENKFIPKSRFNKQIEKTRALEEQLVKEREERIRFETQLQVLQQLGDAQRANVPAETVDEFEPLDSDAHNRYMNKINSLEQKIDSLGQAAQHNSLEAQYKSKLEYQQASFEKSHPDFEKAFNYLKEIERSVAGNFYPADQVEGAINQKLKGAAITAINSGKDAAEIMYNMAKTYGYNAKPEATQGNNVNLDAISNNMKKTASIQSLGNSANMGTDNNVVDINSMRTDPNNPYAPIDPNKFQKALDKLKRAR